MKHMYDLVKSVAILHRQSKIYCNRQLKSSSLPTSHAMYLMALIQTPGLSQEQLAAELRIDKGSVAKMIQLLQKHDLVTKSQNEDDKRIYNLYVTEKTRKMTAEMVRVGKEFEKVMTKNMTEEEKETLKDLLTRAARNVIEGVDEEHRCHKGEGQE